MRIKGIKSLAVAFVLCLAIACMPMFVGTKVVSAKTDSITIAGKTVDMSSFETYGGASIRYDAENQGLRFVTGLSEEKFNELNSLATENGYTVRFGTIVTYSYRVQKCLDNDLDFTKEALDDIIENTEGSKYVDFGVKVFRENPEVANNVEYTAVLGVSEINYSIPMSARGYVVISNGEAEEIYYANYKVLNSTAENVAHTLLENFIEYDINNDTKLKAIAEYTTKDGAEDGYFMGAQMKPFTNDSANVSIETDQAVGGRSDVSKYTLNVSSGWSERLTPAFTSSLTWTGAGGSAWHQNAINRQKIMGFKYVLFDIYLENAFDIYFPTSSTLHSYVKVSTAGNLVYRERYRDPNNSSSILARDTTDEAFTSKVKFYNMAGQQVTSTYSGLWYTVAVDISCNLDLGSNSAVEVALVFNGVNATVYFDNVRYYRTDAWESTMAKTKQEMDLSEFGIMYDSGAGATTTIKTLNGRDNVMFYDMNGGTGSVAGFMFSKGTWTGPDSCASDGAANNRIKTSGVKYISFDVCRGGNSNFIMYLWNGSAYTNFKVVYNTGEITSIPSNVRLFDTNGNLVTSVMTANTWYTMVVEVKYDNGNNWSSIKWSNPWTELGIDNIVYYFSETPSLWK